MAENTAHKRGGLQIEYAKSSRAACKGCGRNIEANTMRVGKETPSDYHDGWDLSWYHFKCCNSYGPRFAKIADLKDWELLRWEDQIVIKKITGETIETSEAEKRREKENIELWELKDELDAQVPNKHLKTILEANGVPVQKMTPARLIHKVADGMLWGVIGPCPTCKNEGALRYTGFDFICKTGWVSSFTRCDFRGTTGVDRYKWKIPEDVLSGNKFLKSWKPPADHPKNYKKEGGNEESKEEEEKEEEQEPEEKDDGLPEDEVPVGMEMHGMKIAIAGTKKDLGMTQDELADLIEKHGGEIHDNIGEGTTVMIATEQELAKKKLTKKVQSALTQNIPILSVQFVQNLAELKEEGIKLRNNDVAKQYLVGSSSMSEGRIAKI